MALRYVVKKTVFGFDKQKTEKFVAKNVITNTVDFQTLCEEITKVGLVPSGVVKFVLDALIDTLNINLRKGISVQLGDFGCFCRELSREARRLPKRWIVPRSKGLRLSLRRGINSVACCVP